MLALENIGKLKVNHQSFLPQIYGILNIHILFVGHGPQSFPPN